MLMQAKKLLRQNPDYKTQLDNIEAVIHAQRQWNKRDEHKISCDALSAAMVKSMRPEGANAVTISGYKHINGIVETDSNTDGTFAQHLAATHGNQPCLSLMNTTTALAGSRTELKALLTEHPYDSISRDLMRQHHPFHLPTMLAIDSGEVVADDVQSGAPKSLAAKLIAYRKGYETEKPHLKDAAFPTAANLEEVARSTEGIARSAAVRDALEAVHASHAARHQARRNQMAVEKTKR